MRNPGHRAKCYIEKKGNMLIAADHGRPGGDHTVVAHYKRLPNGGIELFDIERITPPSCAGQ